MGKQGQPNALLGAGTPVKSEDPGTLPGADKGDGNKKPPKGGKRKGTKNGDDANPEPQIPKHNKKVAGKITALTSKSTDIRCLETVVTQSDLQLARYGVIDIDIESKEIGVILNMHVNIILSHSTHQNNSAIL